MVLDADGLNLLAASGRILGTQNPRPKDLVLTPHPGEFARLAAPLGIPQRPRSDRDRGSAAAALARAHGAVVVLKGRGTAVSDGDRLYMNTTGNPAMATAGSGDVLTGLIAALLAQGLGGFEAAVLGTYLHGFAGDLWEQEHGPSGLTARDLAALLPAAVHRHRGGHPRSDKLPACRPP